MGCQNSSSSGLLMRQIAGWEETENLPQIQAGQGTPGFQGGRFSVSQVFAPRGTGAARRLLFPIVQIHPPKIDRYKDHPCGNQQLCTTGENRQQGHVFAKLDKENGKNQGRNEKNKHR